MRGEKRSSRDRGSRCADMAKSIAEKYVKHDLAVNRTGNLSYTDPLHEKEYHSRGKNPGDTIEAKWSNVSGQSTQSNLGHGGTHGNRFNHPLGKNPGDTWQTKKETYIGNNPHRMRLQKKRYIALNLARSMDLSHPKGKNPGDIISLSRYPPHEPRHFQLLRMDVPHGGHTGKTIRHDNPLGKNLGDVIRIGMHHGSSLTSGRATHHEGQIIGSHPLGKNPGDTMHLDRDKTAVEDFRTGKSMRLPPEPQNPEAFHPKGKNPGDIIKTRRDSSEIMAQCRIHRYHSRTGVHQEGINLGRYRYAKGGKNPGDVIKQADEMMKRHPTHPPHHAPRIRLSDWNPHEWVQHPLGKNPGDIILEKGVKAEKANVKDGRLNGVCPDCGGTILNLCILDDPNSSDFWSITTKPFKGPHFAVYPEEICIKPIKSSCPPSGIILDPMCGSGTTLIAAKKLGRKCIGFDINPKYVDIAKKRLREISTK